MDPPRVVSERNGSHQDDPFDGGAADNTVGRATDDSGREGADNRTAEATLPAVTPTRQVLIVGDTIPGLALATFFERAGHDPVLLRTPAGRTPSTITTVWPSSLHLLDFDDTDDAVRAAGQPLDAVTVRESNSTAAEQRVLSVGPDEIAPLIIETETLRRILRDRIGPETTSVSSTIVGISDRPNAIEVEFENGVREQFDLVIAADGADSSVRTRVDPRVPDWTAFTQLERTRRQVEDAPTAVLDNWWDETFGQIAPSPSSDGDMVIRLTTAGSNGLNEGRATEMARSMLSPSDVESTGTEISVHPSWDEQRRVWQATPGNGSWADGRVAYCGSAAFPVTPAAGLQTGLAIEDAWVLADELSGRQESAADVVKTYGRRRRDRVRTIHRRSAGAHSHHSYPLAHSEPLATLSQGRATALGAHCAVSLVELQEAVPNRL